MIEYLLSAAMLLQVYSITLDVIGEARITGLTKYEIIMKTAEECDDRAKEMILIGNVSNRVTFAYCIPVEEVDPVRN